MRNPKFKVLKSIFNNQYYYTLRSAHGKMLLSNEGYATKVSCLQDIQFVQAFATLEHLYVKKELPDFTFILQSPDGAVIGRSEPYRNRFGRDTVILGVRRDALHAVIVDLAF